MRNPSDGDGTCRPTKDPLRVVLPHRHREAAVRCLATADATLHIADLVRDVVRLDPPATPDDGDAITRLYVKLYHVHLPKLCEAGVVSFDAESRLVSMAADLADVEASLASGTGSQRRGPLAE